MYDSIHDPALHVKCDADIVRLGKFQDGALAAAEAIAILERRLFDLIDAGTISEQKSILFQIGTFAKAIINLKKEGDLLVSLQTL